MYIANEFERLYDMVTKLKIEIGLALFICKRVFVQIVNTYTKWIFYKKFDSDLKNFSL